MEEENIYKGNDTQEESGGITRREFFKQGSIALASAALAGVVLNRKDDLKEIDNEKIFSPKIINGVEVYGVNNELDSEKKVLQLYDSLDRRYEKEHRITISNKWEQKRELLNPQERYLEVVVLKSAYEQYLQRAEKTGENFVDWIKIHVDTLNMCLHNAEPNNHVTAILNRILVVDDKATDYFYNEKEKDLLGGALDYKWGSHFFGKLSIDTDCSWAISEDSRQRQDDALHHNYYWGYKNNKEKRILGWPPGAKEYKFSYEYPQEEDTCQERESGWLDMGLIHEWSHYLLNLPDEYNFDISYEGHRFKNFFLRNGYYWGSFHEPMLSPYLSSFLKKNSEEKKRYWFSASEAFDFQNRPERIEIDFQGEEIEQLEIRRVLLDKESIEYSNKSYPVTPDYVVKSDKFLFDESLFKEKSHSWLVGVHLTNGEIRELNFPAACFQMSENASIRNAHYKIKFSGYENSEYKTQIGMIVDKEEINKWMEENEKRGIKHYASMEIDGTDSSFLWFISESHTQ